jgi:methylated-DNA-[protein]-cysteine S-methyltransferase
MDSAIVQTRFGSITLVADEQGLAQIILPDITQSRQTTDEKITGQYPVLHAAARQITEYIEGRRFTFDLPLSLTGTQFQLQVWRIIKNIPYGQTLSYKDIARKLGDPKKARAVGGAANANPLPLVIPCHRVIGADGSLTGFAGGLGLKQKLLQLEQKYAIKR